MKDILVNGHVPSSILAKAWEGYPLHPPYKDIQIHKASKDTKDAKDIQIGLDSKDTVHKRLIWVLHGL